MMSKIYMDVNQCRSARRQIADTKSDLQTYASRVINSGNVIVGYSWRARGAEQYLTELIDWKTDLTKLLSKLGSLERKLGSEIEEWIRVDKDF